MTEQEWLTAEFSDPMLRFLEPKVSDRKLHCFAIACAKRIAQLLVHPSSLHGVEVLERFVEGQCSADEMRRLSWDVEGGAFAVESGHGVPFLHLAEQLSSSFLSELVANRTYSFQSARHVLTSAAYFVDAIFSSEPWERRTRHWPPNAQGSGFRPVALVHEIFGNPFRAVSFSPEWRTSTVVAIAKAMYDSRDFAPMPLLADALQDAGCEHADILDHCRGAGPHVRGCWVVDLALGKS